MSDFEKKTLRHFYCRDALWQAFEQVSEMMDRGMDELINEAMAAYVREHGAASLSTTPMAARVTGPGPRGVASEPAPRAPVPSVPPPLPPPRSTAARPAVPPVPSASSPRIPAPNQPPPPPGAGAPEVPAPPLYLIFDNRKYRIDKDQFIIGRGVKSSDLPIRDGNISRKHAAIIRRNGAYFIKDLGSTNGIDFAGNRIDNRRIEEGDVYYLCDYPLRFTFQQ